MLGFRNLVLTGQLTIGLDPLLRAKTAVENSDRTLDWNS